jgi:hypothetical protein
VDIDSLLGIARESPGVILTVLALYLFKVVVNDMKHDVESMKHMLGQIQSSLARIADTIERAEKRGN